MSKKPDVAFDPIDQQLARLLQRLTETSVALTAEQKTSLRALVLYVSQQTRLGVIAVPLAGMPDTVDVAGVCELPVLGKQGDYAPIILSDTHVWLNRYWRYERRLATCLADRVGALLPQSSASGRREYIPVGFEAASMLPRPSADDSAISASDADGLVVDFPETDWQEMAIAMASVSPFLIISGGPGTGKTTTVTRILAQYIGQGVSATRILLAAPTGKAAMRMAEAIRHTKHSLGLPEETVDKIPEQASTLHRLLGYVPGRVGFRHNAKHPLSADVVIVDEASMIDIALMTHLFEAIAPETRLILLGDKDQLASVETGSIFRDLCMGVDNHYSPERAKQLEALTGVNLPVDDSIHPLHDHIVVLQKSWRFSADSGIGQLATAIREGESAALSAVLQGDYADIHWDEQVALEREQLLAAWGDYLKALRGGNPAQAFAAFNAFRILTPLRVGLSGTESLNQRVERLLRGYLGRRDGRWYSGRPVMITQNDYRQALFNGDVGITLPDDSGALRVYFPDNQAAGQFRSFAPVRLPAHETAWAMTIHKSQGSEFERVLLLMPDHEASQMLGRELLYTGVTRAKRELFLMGTLNTMQRSLRQVTPLSSQVLQRIKQI